ncbi:hypothetical protein GCM10007977_095360 [Dactylosporangium sucinum]|uniref:Uncharacterized protein n=1 Tax=Dactylosporangium sucinum TaxID=1424081 RepID=A0A917UBZ9_9ACTN|nr:hypothetical protein GCM10007977_095360 [Dactylosporangium sucinum]
MVGFTFGFSLLAAVGAAAATAVPSGLAIIAADPANAVPAARTWRRETFLLMGLLTELGAKE